MTTLDAKNRSADQFRDSHIPLLREISEPLRALGITHFSYHKLIGKDKALILCPQISMLREHFGHSLDKTIVQAQLDQIHQQKKFLFWQNFDVDNAIFDKLRESDINHGFTLFRIVEEDIYESFHFATTNDNEQIRSFYFKNILLLNVFADYFVHIFADIIDHQDPGKLTHIVAPK